MRAFLHALGFGQGRSRSEAVESTHRITLSGSVTLTQEPKQPEEEEEEFYNHNVGRYRQMRQLQHQDYVLAPYLSALKTSEAIDSSADSDVVAMVSM